MNAPQILRPAPLTGAAFAPYGDVIEAAAEPSAQMNDGTLERFDTLARVQLDDPATCAATLSIARVRRAMHWPVTVTCVERHPLGSQAFIPLTRAPVAVVVAPPGERVEPADLRAFISNGRQGVNYHRGVWHVPLIVLEPGQDILIVERGGPGTNCDLFYFDVPLAVAPDAAGDGW